VKKTLEELQKASIGSEEPLRELFLIALIDRDYYQAVIDVVRERRKWILSCLFFIQSFPVEKSERVYQTVVNSIRGAVYLNQGNLGDLNIESDTEKLVSYRGFLQGLTIILDFLTGNIGLFESDE